MGLATRNLQAFLMMAALFQVSLGAVYMVGDSAGWMLPILGIVDYNKWTSNKTFHVGDIIIFNYNSLFHNVREVTHQNFKNCNATSPIVSYDSGFDAITLKTLGHWYFICGVAGHCQMGMKVDIKVTPFSPPPTASPAPAPAPISGA
ncbi:stellacyanin-like [Pistacia vera]|uniref:stellacyanin-like n=1 Tax=Pistacia vera TaxID=55513 RepID=UPI001263216E|nr:stellacyanin-like [Pistacia vera]